MFKYIDFSDLLGEGETCQKWAVAQNGDNFVWTNNEFIHGVDNINDAEPYHIPVFPTFREIVVTPAELVARATGATVDMREWGHYFGIKGRIKENYRLLAGSVEEIGLDPSMLPPWK